MDRKNKLITIANIGYTRIIIHKNYTGVNTLLNTLLHIERVGYGLQYYHF